MTSPLPGRPLSARSAWRALVLTLLPGVFVTAINIPARAQGNFNTVRSNELRSRWANYQVDRPPPQAAAGTDGTDATATQAEQTGLLAAFGKSFDDLLRNGPLQVRSNFAAGWEFSDEENLRVYKPDGVNNSFFVAPSVGLFYNQEQGPFTLSARYSVGYVYYLDQNYLGAIQQGGNLSHTAGLDLGLDGSRLSLTSHTAGSYGNGNDIESGQNRNVLDLSETLGATYPLTEFTQLGATAFVGYTRTTGGTLAELSALSDSGSVYGDYVITGKTRLRFELDTGDQLQRSPGMADSGRFYYQAILSANYVPAPKFTFDAGLGYGFQSDSNVMGRGRSGSHPVYRITIQYVPTPKTTASFHFGYEGVDVDPDAQLSAQWQFRINTAASLSIYQNSAFSDYLSGQNIVTRGVLVSLQQHLFARMDVSVSSGIEETRGFVTASGVGGAADSPDPYYFAGVSLLYEINSYLAIQGYYRGYTGQAGQIIAEKGLQSRAGRESALDFLRANRILTGPRMKTHSAALLALLAMAACLLPNVALQGQNPVPSSPQSILPRNPANQSASAVAKQSGASSDNSAIAAPAAGGAASPPPAVASVSGDYVLSPSDTLEMTIFNEPGLATQTRISADGTVQFPLIGELRLGGMPVRDARELIRRRYNADYLVEPQVYLNVLGYAQRRFTVLGQVNRPGTYDFPGGERLGLLQAIGLAGDFTRLANKKEVEIKHAAPNSPTIRVNVKKLTTSDGKAFDLSPGDVINVKESWL